MKKENLMPASVIVLFVLVGTALIFDVYFYNSLKTAKTEISAQKDLTTKQFDSVSAELNAFKTELGAIKSELGGQSNAITALTEKLDANDSRLNEILSAVESTKSEIKGMKTDIREWQKDYVTALLMFEEKTNSFQSELMGLKESLAKKEALEIAEKTQMMKNQPVQIKQEPVKEGRT